MYDFNIPQGNKSEIYSELYKQIKSVVESESDVIANMANVASMIHETFRFWWTGFYRVAEEELILGPFQGPLACTRIKKGRGVCGTSWQQRKTIIVPDVELFPGHIACSSQSKSEIVVPIYDSDGVVKAVLDIDSEHLNTFDTTDQIWLEKITQLI